MFALHKPSITRRRFIIVLSYIHSRRILQNSTAIIHVDRTMPNQSKPNRTAWHTMHTAPGQTTWKTNVQKLRRYLGAMFNELSNPARPHSTTFPSHPRQACSPSNPELLVFKLLMMFFHLFVCVSFGSFGLRARRDEKLLNCWQKLLFSLITL